MLRSLLSTSIRPCARLSHSIARRAVPLCQVFSTCSVKNIQFIEIAKDLPQPTDTVPDVQAFLSKIGRNTAEYAENFESWESFMTMTSQQMKDKGIDTRQRRYILAWREKFCRGEELKEIKQGKKSWGGERRRKAIRAAHFGRLRAEERAKEKS